MVTDLKIRNINVSFCCRFDCDICYRPFKSKISLKQHKNIHKERVDRGFKTNATNFE